VGTTEYECLLSIFEEAKFIQIGGKKLGKDYMWFAAVRAWLGCCSIPNEKID
jgi:hypothetical protein